MLAHSRNLLLFCALAGAALATWALARKAQTPPLVTADETMPARRGYYMLDAVLYATDASGQVSYRILADRLELASRDDDFLLEGVRVEYSPESAVRWGLSAAHAVLSRDRSLLELDNVKLSSNADQDETESTFETSKLLLETENLVARTDQPILFRHGDSALFATGLKADLGTDEYVLEANVMTQRAALAAGMIALLPLAAQGQAREVDGDDTLACEMLTGSMRDGEHECRGFAISYGESTRMSADRAWAATNGFDQGEVRLSGNVRIQIESAELIAESGSAMVDGDELNRLTLIGEPVQIRHDIPDSEVVVTGEALEISYDRASDTFEMQGDVRFASDGNAIEACALSYVLGEMRYAIGSDRGCGSLITLGRTDPEETRDEPSNEP